MSHTDIIIITSTLLFASTFGVYAAIRVINRHTRPPVNSLEMPRAIELVDYIEPNQPPLVHTNLDLLEAEFPIYERISNYIPYSGTVPSQWSANPPSYQTTNSWYINSCLENSINLDYFIILLFFLILILIFKLRYKFLTYLTPF